MSFPNSDNLLWFSEGLTLLLSGLFGIAALGKVVHWTDVRAVLSQFQTLTFDGGPVLVGALAIVVEMLTAGLLLWRRTRRVGAGLAFLLLNLFFWGLALESWRRGAPVDCPRMGWGSLGPGIHAALTLGSGGVALLLFLGTDGTAGRYRPAAFAILLYFVYAGGAAWTTIPRAESRALRDSSQSIGRKAWNQLTDPPKSSSQSFLIVARLEDFSCSACQQSIEGMLRILARDSVLRRQTRLLTTTQDTSHARRRVDGWLQIQEKPLPEHRPLSYHRFSETGLRASAVLYRPPETDTVLYRAVPFQPYQTIREFIDRPSDPGHASSR